MTVDEQLHAILLEMASVGSQGAAHDQWLRTTMNGGMPTEHAEIVRNVVNEAARFYLWKALVPVLRGMSDTSEDAKQEAKDAWAKVTKLQDSITKALAEIEDAGPKALKYAEQELRKGLRQ